MIDEPEMQSDLNNLRKFRDLGGYSDDVVDKIIAEGITKLTNMDGGWSPSVAGFTQAGGPPSRRGGIDGSRCWEAVSYVFGDPGRNPVSAVYHTALADSVPI